MQRVTFVVLLLLAIGLGSYVYFEEFKGEEARQQQADAEKQLFKVKLEDVQSLDIQNSHGTFAFNRTNGKWRLSQPADYEADVRAVEDAIFGLDALRFEKVVDEAASDLTPFGLATPAFKMTARTAAGELTLLLGDEAPFGAGRYMLKGGEQKVYLSSYPLRDRIDKDLLGWRERKLLSFTLSDVQSLTLTGTQEDGSPWEGLSLKREGERWSSAHNAKFVVDGGAVDALLYDLQALQTVAFTGQTDASLFGLQSPRLTARLELGEGKGVLELLLGAPFGEEQRLPAVRSLGEEIRLIDGAVLSKLKKGPNDLRDSRVLNLKRLDITRLEFKLDEQTLVATRENDSWKLDGSLKEKVRPADIDAVLDDLVGLRAEKFIDQVQPADLARFGMDSPELTLQLTEKDAAPISLSIANGGDASSPEVYARVGSDSTLSQVNKYLLQDLRDVLLKSGGSGSGGSGSGGSDLGGSDLGGSGSGAPPGAAGASSTDAVPSLGFPASAGGDLNAPAGEAPKAP